MSTTETSPKFSLGLWLAGTAVVAALAVGLALIDWKKWFAPPETAPVKVDAGPVADRAAIPVPKVRFTDITGPAGIRFRHTNGAFGQKLLPETMGAGVGVIDFDDDDKPDLLFVNGRPWPGHEKAGEPPPTLALYRNLGGKFEDVTRAAGLGVTMYGLGVTVGDYDNDGYPDLFVSGLGGSRLFHNEPAPPGQGVNGRWFRDVTAAAGVGGPDTWPDAKDGDFLKRDKPLNFSSSAAWLDYDGDGRLDLFVCNYVTWSPARDLGQGFSLDGTTRKFGPPTFFEGAQCFLYRNPGGGKFRDVSAEAGVQVWEREGAGEKGRRRNLGKCLGVIVCDADDDGWPDIVVANDTVRNFLFHNEPGPGGTRVFKEVGFEAGVAYAEGKARGAMGIDWAPFYRPGCNALAIGNFADEPNTFLCQEGPRELAFSDVANVEGIAGPSKHLLKFGVLFLDYDLDGRPDLLTCNGQLEPEIARLQRGQDYEQPPQLFWNAGLGQGFEPVTPEAAGPDLFRPLVGRGCAYADIDGNGTPDIILTANGGPARLLRNDGGTGHHWLRLKLRGDGKRSNRSAVGARVTLEAGGVVQKREVCAARGYLSQSELVLTFGLGKTTKVDRVIIHWPGRDAGPPTVLTDVEVDRLLKVAQ
jgi:enediyne biosynthesis protein E4